MAHRRPNGRAVLAAQTACLLLGAACAGPAPYGGVQQIPPLTTSSILAPVPPHPEAELAWLERQGDDPAVVLRRAYIHLQQGELRYSLQLDNQVLYGADTPSPAEEALALYLRSAAHEALGDQESAAEDRTRALELALDDELRRRLRAAAEPAPVVETLVEPAAVDLSILPRSAWRARPERPAYLGPMGNIYRLTIHHSAMSLDSTAPMAAAQAIQQIQRNDFRKTDPVWGDIGYHYIIDPAGRIWEARKLRWQGAHSEGKNNRGNLGICVLGNFVPGSSGQTPTAAQVRTLRAFTAQLCREYGIPVEQIYTHRELKATECPGDRLQVVVNQMRREMAALASARVGGSAKSGK